MFFFQNDIFQVGTQDSEWFQCFSLSLKRVKQQTEKQCLIVLWPRPGVGCVKVIVKEREKYLGLMTIFSILKQNCLEIGVFEVYCPSFRAHYCHKYGHVYLL